MSLAAPRRFLVTGGAGFIGRRLAANLLADGAEVAILDNLTVGLPMPSGRPGLSTYEADIRIADKVASILAGFRPDCIVHLAAIHHIPTCEQQRVLALEVNVLGTEILLEQAEKAGVGSFVLASSGAVYDWTEGPLHEDESPLRPADNYGLGKFANEQQLRFWAARTGASARIARIFNTIGHDDPNAHLIPDIVAQIGRDSGGAEIRLGNTTPRRDYIHADDTARAIAAIARDATNPGVEVYNVGSGEEISVAGLVGLLSKVMRTPITIIEDPERKRRIDRPSQLASVEKIRSRLGFMPRKSLRIALEEIVAHRLGTAE